MASEGPSGLPLFLLSQLGSALAQSKALLRGAGVRQNGWQGGHWKHPQRAQEQTPEEVFGAPSAAGAVTPHGEEDLCRPAQGEAPALPRAIQSPFPQQVSSWGAPVKGSPYREGRLLIPQRTRELAGSETGEPREQNHQPNGAQTGPGGQQPRAACPRSQVCSRRARGPEERPRHLRAQNCAARCQRSPAQPVLARLPAQQAASLWGPAGPTLPRASPEAPAAPPAGLPDARTDAVREVTQQHRQNHPSLSTMWKSKLLLVGYVISINVLVSF